MVDECVHFEENTDQGGLLLGISEDCPLVDRKDYVTEGVTRNLEKVFGSLSSGDKNELEKTMA